MNKRSRTLTLMTCMVLAMHFSWATVYTWTGGTDGDWSNPLNWDVNGIPATDLDGSLVDAANTVTITNGTFAPTINLPTLPSSAFEISGPPLFDIRSGVSLSLAGISNQILFCAENKTAISIESGGSLSLSAAVTGSTREIYLARGLGTQTLNISGTLSLDAANFHLSHIDGQNSIINLDGGTVNLTDGTIFGARTNSGDFTTIYNQINLDNGATFNAPLTQIRNTVGGLGGYTVVVDIKDSASSFIFERGRDFNSTTDVENAFGTVFISSTLGNDQLSVSANGNIYTVSAVRTDFIWTGSVDGDWSNPLNWEGNELPPTASGSLVDTINTIVITNGTFAPVSNLPTLPASTVEGTGTPLFDIRSGASLSLNAAGTTIVFPAVNKTAVSVESGGTLTFTSTGEIYLARTGGTLTWNVSGTLNFDNSRVEISNVAGRNCVFNLDGGVVNVTGTDIWGSRGNTGGDFSALPNEVNLANGSSFGGANAVLSRTLDADGDPTVVFDLQDAASSVIFHRGRDFNSLTDVENAFGTVFTSSTLGDGTLAVSSPDGNLYTVTAGNVAEPVPVLSTTISGADLLISCASDSAFNYTLQDSADLSPSSWADVETKPGDGLELVFTVPAPTAGNKAFYRVVTALK